jgi:hypothetical protein
MVKHVLKKSRDTFMEAKGTHSHRYLHSHECNINASIKLMIIIYAQGNNRGTLIKYSISEVNEWQQKKAKDNIGARKR